MSNNIIYYKNLQTLYTEYIQDILKQHRLSQCIVPCSYINDPDLLICDITDIDLSHYKTVKYIICPCTNIEHLLYKMEHQLIFSLKQCYDNLDKVYSTAEHTINLCLSLLRPYKSKFFRPKVPGALLRNKTVGILGYGRIGHQLVELLHGFNVNILIYDTKYMPEVNTTKEDLLRQSDIIIITSSIKLNDPYVINENDFKGMVKDFTKKKYLVNVSRGYAIDEKSLYHYRDLFEGIGLDVIHDSNMIEQLERSHPNIILTPHLGGYTKEDIQTTFYWCFTKFINYYTTFIKKDNK